MKYSELMENDEGLRGHSTPVVHHNMDTPAHAKVRQVTYTDP